MIKLILAVLIGNLIFTGLKWLVLVILDNVL